jgi:hypothetical protein
MEHERWLKEVQNKERRFSLRISTDLYRRLCHKTLELGSRSLAETMRVLIEQALRGDRDIQDIIARHKKGTKSGA